MELFFKTPVYIVPTNVTKEFLQDLEKDIYEMKNSSKSLQISNINGWHSETDLFAREEASIKELCKLLIGETTKKLCSISQSFNPNDYNGEFGGWINVNPKGGANAVHTHNGWHWSGVFYVKQPMVKEGRSGMIEFINPSQEGTEIAKGFSNIGFDPYIRVRPEVGNLVIFPSYLLHSVYPNESDEDRITVAYNLRLTRKTTA
jgi:uncharacterized protein (TIGR02466 family)